MTFLKNNPRPCATLKEVFLDRFELVVPHFGPPKIPKCLENGLFWDQKWVKKGSKTHFFKPHPRPCATLKQVFLDRFELVVAHFGPPKIPKCLENGLFWDQKWVKNGSKTHFFKPHPRPFGVHKRVK